MKSILMAALMLVVVVATARAQDCMGGCSATYSNDEVWCQRLSTVAEQNRCINTAANVATACRQRCRPSPSPSPTPSGRAVH